jgi:hypothetical protein
VYSKEAGLGLSPFTPFRNSGELKVLDKLRLKWINALEISENLREHNSMFNCRPRSTREVERRADRSSCQLEVSDLSPSNINLG